LQEINEMLKAAIDFMSLLLASLVAGAMFGVWLGFNPAGLSAAAYITVQQRAIGALNVTMPTLGAFTIALIAAAAGLSYGDRTRFTLLMAAAACFVLAGLVTRFLNQPINAVVIAWSPAVPPVNWAVVRDAWWRHHQLRTGIGIAGLGAMIAAALVR
jgi:hypothetical protein